MAMAHSAILQSILRLRANVVTHGVRFIATRIFGFRIEITGQENIPPGEPLIVAGGPHRNWIDAFLLIVAMPPQPRLTFLASEAADDIWWRGLIVKLTGGFEPVSTTSTLNREALAAAERVLARGDRLGIFPEGWDHLDAAQREIGELRRGVAFIAQQSGRRVLPVALAGSKPLWRGKTLRIQIGAPLDPPPPSARRVEQEAWSENLHATLQALLPPEPPEIPVSQRHWTWLTTWLN